MNKTVLAIIVGVFVLGGAAVFAMNNKSDDKQNNSSDNTMMPGHNSNSAAPTTNGEQPAASGEVLEGEVKVEISNFEFKPSVVKVKKGSTVTWTNQDDAKHDVTPDSESENFKGSELLGKGESYSYTFDTVGSYSYNCSPHPYMKASVEVVE